MCSNSIFNKIVKSHTVVTIPCRVLWSNEDNTTSTWKMYYYRMFTSFPSHTTSNHHMGKKPEDVTTLMCYRMCHIYCCVPCFPAHNVIVKTHATPSYILLLTCHLLLPDPLLLWVMLGPVFPCCVLSAAFFPDRRESVMNTVVSMHTSVLFSNVKRKCW